MSNIQNAGIILKNSLENNNESWIVERWTLPKINSDKKLADREIIKAFETEDEAINYASKINLKQNDRQVIKIRQYEI